MAETKFTVKESCYIAIFAAIIAAMAQISIPMPAGVPMTLQTLAIPLAGIVLGKRNGMISTVVYILLGTVGLPVFANMTGGFGRVFGPTGGFILSFPLMALLAGWGAARKKKIWLWVCLVAGAVVNYLVGMLVFVLVMPSTWGYAFTACVLPFIPTTVVKIIIAALLGEKLRNILLRAKVLA